MRIGICDDEKIWQKKAEQIIKEFCREKGLVAEVLLFCNRKELMETVESLDILFMDIDLEKENGIQLVHEINDLCPECFVIYLTNYLFYASDVYETKHDYFVLKEQFEVKLGSVMKLYEKIRKTHHGKIAITSIDKVTSVLPVKQIMYLERSARTTKIITINGIYVVKNKIEDMVGTLSEYEFIRSHKSFMVNPLYVTECRRSEFVVEDGREIPISRRYEKVSRESFLQWASAHLI